MGTTNRNEWPESGRRFALTRIAPWGLLIGFATAGLGCSHYGASHPSDVEESRRPWVAPGERAEPVSIDSWDIVKGSSRAYGFRYRSQRWFRCGVLDDVLRYRSELGLASLNNATYAVVSINPTCGLMKEEVVRDPHRLSVWMGPFEGEWAWFCASRTDAANWEPPIPARDGEPFAPPGADYRLVLRDGNVYAIDRAD